jgi:hypothetical protein
MPRAQFEALEAYCQVWHDQGINSDKSTVKGNDGNDDAEVAGDPQGEPALVKTRIARTQSTCLRESFSLAKEWQEPFMTTR